MECLLLIFIYFNSKFKVTYKNGDFKCRYIRTHSEEKPSKIFNITFAILPFSHQNTLTKLLSWVLWSLLLLMKPSEALQNGSFKPKNAKSRVRQSQVWCPQSDHPGRDDPFSFTLQSNLACRIHHLSVKLLFVGVKKDKRFNGGQLF